MNPSLGYAIDHPDAIASIGNPRRWDTDLLMAAQPLRAAPDHYLADGLPDSPLNQNPIGACTMFAGETIQNVDEARDEGRYLFSTASAFVGWDWLKHGSPDGSWPGDSIPESAGDIPENVWKLAKVYGLPDRNGRVHKISAYYSHSFAGPDDFAYLQQVILAFGPVNFGIPWQVNWFASPAGPDYKMPEPGGAYGGHAIACVGWDVYPDGSVWLVFVQTWGDGWGGPKGTYRIRATWLYGHPLGPQIFWKVVDLIDAPHPEPVTMTLPIFDAAPKDQLVDLALGTQCYAVDGKTALAKIASGGTGVQSPFAVSATQRLVRISVGGVVQAAVVATADCLRMRGQNSHKVQLYVDDQPAAPAVMV